MLPSDIDAEVMLPVEKESVVSACSGDFWLLHEIRKNTPMTQDVRNNKRFFIRMMIKFKKRCKDKHPNRYYFLKKQKKDIIFISTNLLKYSPKFGQFLKV